MKVLYIDELLLLNFLVNFFLLLGAAHLGGVPRRHGRLFLGAAVGALYALIVVLPNMSWASAAGIKAAAGLLMTLISFGHSRRLLRTTLLFFGVSFAFGGSVLAMGFLRSGAAPLSAGLVYAPAGLRLLLCAGALCYGLFLLVFGRLARHGGLSRDLVAVRLTLEKRSVELTALCDTGNTLSDPLGGGSVLVADYDALLPLLRPELRALFTAESLARPAELLARLGELEAGKGFRLIPYAAVGVREGLLLALRPDAAAVGGAPRQALLAAFSPTPVSDGGGYTALIGK